MDLECLILRKGKTVVDGPGNVRYEFRPIPGSRKDEVTTSVCDVANEEMLQRLLLTGQYREYDPEVATRDLQIRRLKKNKLAGFSFEPSQDKAGYIIVDRRSPHLKFAGRDGNWKPERDGIAPFRNEIEAYDWLKMDREASDEEEPVPQPDSMRTVLEQQDAENKKLREENARLQAMLDGKKKGGRPRILNKGQSTEVPDPDDTIARITG